jgi:hypothetical protein
MLKLTNTVIVSTLFFAVVGPMVVLLELFFARLALHGVAEPMFLLYPFAMLFGGGFVAGSVGLTYGLLFAIFYSFPFIGRRISSKTNLVILGACIAFICSVAFSVYLALHEKAKTDAVYVGKLEKLKPENGFWKNYSQDFVMKNLGMLFVPTMLCGIAVPLLMPNSLLKRAP